MGLILSGTFVGLFIYLKPDPIAEDIAKGNQIKIVFTVNDEYRLLFSNLFCYDTTTGQGALFDIPAETGIWDGRVQSFRYLNHYYLPTDLKSFSEEVSRFAGDVYPHYINLSTDSIANLVDLLGGIEVFLVDPISSEIDGEIRLLPAGTFNMLGYQSRLYLSERLPGETSVEFIKRKQNFLKSIFIKLKNVASHFTNNLLQKQFMKLIESNLDSQSIATLLNQLSTHDPELLQIHQLRGENKTVNGVVYFLPQNEGNLFKEKIRQISKALTDSSFVRRELRTLNLQVLNSTKRNLLAARTTEYYQSYGYNVIATGNFAIDNNTKTIIYFRLPEFERAAKRIGELIQCTNILFAGESQEYFNNWNDSDISILLGEDYEPFACR